MDLKTILTLPLSEQLGHLQNAIVDYRCKTDAIPHGATKLPWVTATITAIDPDQQSVFIEGRWIFLKHVELRPNDGQQLKRVVPPLAHDDRRDSANTASEKTKKEMRSIIPGPVPGAAGPHEFTKS